MATKENLNGYNINLDLASGAHLEIYLFDEVEHRWIFTHRFQFLEGRQRLERPKLTNDVTLVVNYNSGIAQTCNLRWHMLRPDKRGKEYFLGVDISRDSLLDIEFIYEKVDDLFRIKKIDMGKLGVKDLDSLGPGLVKSTDMMFPVKDRIENEFGTYKVPFLISKDRASNFEFPRDSRNKF